MKYHLDFDEIGNPLYYLMVVVVLYHLKNYIDVVELDEYLD